MLNAIVNWYAKEDKDGTFENWQKCIRFYIEKLYVEHVLCILGAQ